MVAHDAKTGKATKPVVRDKDGGFPNDPQINAPDRDLVEKPAARLTGYVRGGTSNPSQGESGDVEYLSPDGKTSTAAKVLGSGSEAHSTELQAREAATKAAKSEKK